MLCRALRPETPYLALLAAGALIVSGATWAAFQADGVTLKQADAWVAGLGDRRGAPLCRCQDRSLDRVGPPELLGSLGVAFLLLGAAAVVSRLVPSWLGVLLVVSGLLSLAIGAPSARRSREWLPGRRRYRPQLVVLAFIVGLLIVGRRAPGARARARRAPEDAAVRGV